ncbi:peptidoglycan DD-metalloendopeptidase family protein [Kordia sp.]|uniref:peptidoglycan DD-metalloendopeptidase family protein n=1 Tax=Kordia sp. TaxID=1965332 RepID=UPI003B5CB279
MNSFLFYILQVSLVFGGFYLLYTWFFSRFTFHAFNRSFLLLLLPLSLLLPFSNELFPQLQQFAFEIPLFEDFTAYAGFDSFSEETAFTKDSTVNYGFWIFLIYATGVSCYLARFVWTTFRFIKLKNNSEVIVSNNIKVYIANVSNVFSFFNWIFVPKSKKESCNEFIIKHEKAHIQQLHSVDVVLVELFIAFCWFHPLAYLYRKSLKSIHEFQADAFVLKQNVKKSMYLTLLLNSLEPSYTNPAFNYFSHPTLKKRIEMITKSPSKNSSKLTYMLLIPLIALAFMAFRNAEESLIPSKVLPVIVEIQTEPTLFPVQHGTIKNISSKFGIIRKHPKLKNSTAHGGIDIKATLGTPVVATADGIVMKANEEGNWGNLIVISHADGFETWYAHLKGFNTKKSASVKKGDIIGYVGNTGLSTAPHLHYEVRQHGKRLDPLEYITE